MYEIVNVQTGEILATVSGAYELFMRRPVCVNTLALALEEEDDLE